MQSIIQHLYIKGENIKLLLNSLLKYSDLVRWNHSMIIISGMGDYQWDTLNESGREIQKQLLNEYNYLFERIRFLSMNLPSDQQSVFEASAQKVFAVINQTGNFYLMNKEELFCSAIRALDLQLQLLSTAYEVTDSYHLIIPDISVLLANPEFEKWKFAGIEKYKLLLLPAIVSELDENPANTNHLKNKILEYAKQGNIAVGVALNEYNVIRFVGNIKEVRETLPELDTNNNLDWLIGAYFEIVKTNPHSQVALITNNSSLQEKAHQLNAICIEPPAAENDSKLAENTPTGVKTPEYKPTEVNPGIKLAEEKQVAPKPTRARTSRGRTGEMLVANKPEENKPAEVKQVAVKPTKIKRAESEVKNTSIKIPMPPVMPNIAKGSKPRPSNPKLDTFYSKPPATKPKR